MNFRLLQQSRPDSGAGGNRPDRAIFEFHRCDADVFHFNPFVCECRRHGIDLGNITHQPVQQIHIVNRLIHVSSATVEVPSPAPSRFDRCFRPFRLRPVVVRLSSPPLDEGVTERQFSKTPLGNRLFQSDIGRTES